MSGQFRQMILVALAVQAAVVGVWAGVWPLSFYAGFPGLGREWVEPEGPYSEHLIRDLGTLSLALAVVTAAAAYAARRGQGGRLVAVAWLVYSVPHLAYHIAHRGNLGVLDQTLSLSALALQVILPVLLLVPIRTGRRGGTGPDGQTAVRTARPKAGMGDAARSYS